MSKDLRGQVIAGGSTMKPLGRSADLSLDNVACLPSANCINICF